ncbi:bombyxin F-1-like [Periplaneta americana]|uniref:bombyxin F-1-like n=1 Tax=Periplaneta americana TaxID=6978 RepID=UPI0037E82C1A
MWKTDVVTSSRTGESRPGHDSYSEMWKLCLLVMVTCACALPENLNKRDSSHRYCGRNLVNILSFVCSGRGYNGVEEMEERKRNSHALPDADDAFWWLQLSDEELQFPFRSRAAANTLSNREFRRQTRNDRGIVEECCIVKGCTINELADYCLSR